MLLKPLWQEKLKKDRSHNAGYWLCSSCKAPLASLRFHVTEASRMCGGGHNHHQFALAIRPGLDQRDGASNRGEVAKGSHFKATNRHAARHTPARAEFFEFGALYEEGENQRQLAYARENMKAIRREKTLPEIFVSEEKLPVIVTCPGCSQSVQIESMAEGEAAQKIKKIETENESGLLHI